MHEIGEKVVAERRVAILRDLRNHAAWKAMSDDPTYLAQLETHFRWHAQGRSPRIMTGARRLAAILAVNVVGYSR